MQRGYPKHRLHRPSGLGVVTLSGRDHYTGKYGTLFAQAEYDRLIQEWLKHGRTRLEEHDADAPLTIVELIDRFIQHAELHYRKLDPDTGEYRQTGEAQQIARALGPVKKLFKELPAQQFSPKKLYAVRDEMIARKWAMTTINKDIIRVRRMFRFAANQELVGGDVWHALRSIEPLKRGRSAARETKDVTDVPIEYVEAVLPHVSPTIAAMIRLQVITGMRAGELVIMRGKDIDRAIDDLWWYRPPEHKTKHLGDEREVPLNTQAQAIIKPLIDSKLPGVYLFDPRDAIAWELEQRHAQRLTPLSCGNTPGSNRRSKPDRAPGVRYSVSSYGRAIRRGCDRADAWAKGGRVIDNDVRLVPRWTSHQLRKTFANKVRKEFGYEAEAAALGHAEVSRAATIYAKLNRKALAEKVARAS